MCQQQLYYLLPNRKNSYNEENEIIKRVVDDDP